MEIEQEDIYLIKKRFIRFSFWFCYLIVRLALFFVGYSDWSIFIGSAKHVKRSEYSVSESFLKQWTKGKYILSYLQASVILAHFVCWIYCLLINSCNSFNISNNYVYLNVIRFSKSCQYMLFRNESLRAPSVQGRDYPLRVIKNSVWQA